MTMSTYTATIRWSRTGDDGFAKGQCSRVQGMGIQRRRMIMSL
jgi:hypothetical protein